MFILLCVLVAYVLVTPLFYMKAVKFGMKLSREPEKAMEEPVFHIPEKKEVPKMTAEQDRLHQILTNIENYNGSSLNQKKVEIKHD